MNEWIQQNARVVREDGQPPVYGPKVHARTTS